MPKGYCIVVGNEKGGSGKSTTATHVAVALLYLGYKVAAVDVDAQQGTLSRYMDNRRAMSAKLGRDLAIPVLHQVHPTEGNDLEQVHAQDKKKIETLMEDLLTTYDFVVVDTPGHKHYLSQLVHGYAQTLITPLNDSFVDLDVIANIHPETLEMVKPSSYAHWVWEMKKQLAAASGKSLDWMVVRNRLSSLFDRNKASMGKALSLLGRRLGFRVVAGFSERVIFKEFFLQGLTLLDLKPLGYKMNLSHIAARGELFMLLKEIKLESLQAVVQSSV